MTILSNLSLYGLFLTFYVQDIHSIYIYKAVKLVKKNQQYEKNSIIVSNPSSNFTWSKNVNSTLSQPQGALCQTRHTEEHAF